MPKGTQINKDDIENVKKLHGTGLFNTTQIAKITKRGWGTVHDIIKSGFNYSKYKEILQGKRLRGETKGLTFEDACDEVVKCTEDGKTYGLTELPDVPGETSLDKVFPTKEYQGETIEVTYLTKIQKGVALIVEGVMDQILEENHNDNKD
jgi:hypothetical protein